VDLPSAPDELLEDLTAAQRRAVTVEAAPLCVLAGAGAGKTRVLTRRIAHRAATGDLDPAHTLVITFTRKAASELGDRLAALGLRERVQAGTFHAVASAQLRRWWADRGVTAPTLLDRKARVLGPLAAGRPGLAGIPVAELAGHLEWARARCIDAEHFEEAVAGGRRSLPVPAAAVASLYRRYEDDKRRRGLVDFDDLLARCADAFDADPAFASAQRWRWRHVFVDEFQDVNPLQHRLLLAWLGTSLDLCVVGDPHQAIYSWNGADPRILDTVGERWPTTTVVHLDDNHRCTPQVVAAAAAVLGDAGARLRSTRADGPAVTVRSWSSDRAEAEGVAAAMAEARAGGLPWAEMAVLVRTNAQVTAIADALERAGIPHRAPGRAALVEDPAVTAVVAAWRRAPGTLVQTAVADLSLQLTASGGAGHGDGDDGSAAAISALIDLARSYEGFEGPSTVGGLLAWATAAGADRPGPAAAVTVCSFHRAKGLEWAAVWVCGVEAGLVPIGRAQTHAATDEERRLLYVALTRAGRLLTCSWARTRRFGTATVPRQPSPWLALVAPGAPGDRPEPATVLDADAWRARLDAQRARLDGQRSHQEGEPGERRRPRRPGGPVGGGGRGGRLALPAPDDDLLAALLAWRAGVARASGVPAHVVLHDRTLAALASLRPTDHAALLAVPGVGPVKASRFGPALLDLVTAGGRPAVGT
jgi:DNA helicase-2/ATP-dependent DNA helicase PcrA